MEYTEGSLFHLLEKGTSAVTAVLEAAARLEAAGFEELSFQDMWRLEESGKYYVKHHDTTLFAFTLRKQSGYKDMIRIGAAHTDFPCLRIKPNPHRSMWKYTEGQF